MTADLPHVQRIVRFSLTTADAERTARFYQAAFGCRRIATDRLAGPEFERLMGVGGGADRITLRIGCETVELLQFDVPGRPYPRAASSSDLFFQHFAIVVSDMGRAFERLSGVAGWTAVSAGGPQRLPASSGGVTAFKFRDPEGHPLELLAFPKGGGFRSSEAAGGETCLGIDHSAISVSDGATSVAFYEGLGLAVSARSLNQGPAQERLDGVADAEVDVVALTPPRATPHLELLCYRNVRGRSLAAAPRCNDVASTRIVYEFAPEQGGNDGARLVRDPDGHALLLVSQPSPYWKASSEAERSTEPGWPSTLTRRPSSASPLALLNPVSSSSRVR